MVQSDYEKIVYKFGVEILYSKQEIMDGLKEVGIIKSEKGLVNKIKNKLAFRKRYSHGHSELKIIYIPRQNLYRIVTWPKSS